MVTSTCTERARWTAAEFALLLSPFVAAAYWLALRLRPVETGDTFAYLWQAPISPAYFTGRGLTQRLLYTLCGTDVRAVTLGQLACVAASFLGLQALLRRPGGGPTNLALAAALALAATSFNFTLGNVVVDPDALALAGALLFPVALVYGRGRPRVPLVLLVGTLTIFSRSTAPAVVIAGIAVYLLGSLGARGRSLPGRSDVAALGALAACAVLSARVTSLHDTSVGLNAANNVFQRVLPAAERVRHFQAEHGMPTSPAVAALRGRDVLARLDGRALYRVNLRSRNYELVPGVDPLLRWVESHGWAAYWQHLTLHDPWGTALDVSAALTHLYSQRTVEIRADYAESRANDPGVAKHNAVELRGAPPREAAFDEAFYLAHNLDVAEAVRRGELPSGRAHYDRFGRSEGRLANAQDSAQRRIPTGLLGFDPISGLVQVFASLRLARAPVLALLALLALLGARRAREPRPLLLGSVLLTGGLVAFALGYLGDTMDCERHVAAAVIVLTFGLSLLGVWATARALVRLRG